VKLVYLSYPYKGDIAKNTRNARILGQVLMRDHPDWFVIVPHTAIDGLIFDHIPNSDQVTLSQHLQAIEYEYRVLEIIDIFVIGTPEGEESEGMIWELGYVNHLNNNRKKKIEIIRVTSGGQSSEKDQDH